ncbi:hypothetical protein WJU23_09970 [Prosthecobacter sp. SYSU 5D2]|uniref:hypothetical protein n=1 Tax=Prosthecobacter sp. SYSU 5D2 TaxID=3134134 RepID=UPI0031FE7587
MSAAALRQAFFQLPESEQATLLDDLIVSSCDATWEARLAPEMGGRIDAVERGEMNLHEAKDVLGIMRGRLHPE